MILVYSHRITPRLTYIFRQIFIRILELPVSFTSTIEKFVSHSGPKLSYTHQPLGNEFFIKSHEILFQQGLQEINIEVKNWKGIPAFFYTGSKSELSFDIFAASFYLISRYEEFLPHVKNELGSFAPYQSLAYKNSFLEKPVVDLWAVRLQERLNDFFPELPHNSWKKPVFMPIISVVNPYKYKNKSLLFYLSDSLSFLWKFDLFLFIEQILVLFGLKKDPYDNFQELQKSFSKYKINPQYFFLFAKNSYFDRGLSIYKAGYRQLIKNITDYNNVSLLASYAAQNDTSILVNEIKNLKKLINRPISSVRFNYGLLSSAKSYYGLISQELEHDFSMGYNDEIGYRASTAVPFYFYDLNNDLQTSIKINPIVATEEGLRKFSDQKAFKKLEKIYDGLATRSSIHIISISNSILTVEKIKNSWRDQFLNYLSYHA
ncbi:MAG: hypothetical protein VXY19_00910 [Bacteroidota bacterium]|mgnify:FL=1|nr:hypothetical protein [Bacteroidota bacterium]